VASITLKNVPAEVHAALKQQARLHRRSVDQEAIMWLDLALERSPRDTRSILGEIRSLRAGVPVKNADLRWIDAAKRHGRS
jgi:plasmid stability protein